MWQPALREMNWRRHYIYLVKSQTEHGAIQPSEEKEEKKQTFYLDFRKKESYMLNTHFVWFFAAHQQQKTAVSLR